MSLRRFAQHTRRRHEATLVGDGESDQLEAFAHKEPIQQTAALQAQPPERPGPEPEYSETLRLFGQKLVLLRVFNACCACTLDPPTP